jgi:hypothetical protein
MASTFSDLGIELMATGENAGTWGTKTNTNLQIVEKAIAGYVEKAITDGGTTALTITDGDATESTSVARHAVIKLTGTITGNSIVTVPDSIEKVYIVVNGTSGAFTVQFKTASGTGVTFGASDKGTKLVFSDGTNIVDTSTGNVGTYDLNGETLILDADQDTNITADTDDQIDIAIAGADDFQFTANTFTALSGSTIATNTIAETTSGSGVTIDSVLIKDNKVDVNGTAGAIILDADADTHIGANTDDEILFTAAGEAQLKITDGAILPSTDDNIDLGSSSAQFKDGFFDGTLEADAITVGGTSVLTGGAVTAITSVLNTSLVVGRDADNDIDFGTDNNILFRASGADQIKLVDGALAPVTDNDVDLGTSSLEFKDAFFDGTVTTDALAADTANIDGGSVDGATLGTNSAITQAVIDNINIDGATIGHTSDTDLLTLASGVVTVAGEVSMTTLDIGGTNVTSTATELNILDGVTSTTAEINLIDGGATIGTTAVADGDGILHNDGGTMRVTSAATFKTYFQSGVTASGVAADDISSGDAAVNLTTSSGNITIDAAANDSDIIFKGTDNTADITMLTLDGSEAGKATFNDQVVIGDGKLVLNSTAVTSTAAELNLLDGVSGLVQADFTKLAAVDSTAAELNIVDGGTSATSTTVADADRVVLNDNGTMVQVAVTDLAAYFDDEITAMPNLTSVGTLTTLTVDNIIINGTTIGHTDDTDLITVADGIATVAGEISVTTLDIGGTNVAATAAELNIMDGDTSASSTTLVDADRVVTNDAGTMKQVALSDVKTYINAPSKGLSIVFAMVFGY